MKMERKTLSLEQKKKKKKAVMFGVEIIETKKINFFSTLSCYFVLKKRKIKRMTMGCYIFMKNIQTLFFSIYTN
jgi:uncharacterized membrane protein